MIHLPFVEISTSMHVSPSVVIRAFPPLCLVILMRLHAQRIKTGATKKTLANVLTAEF